MELRIEYVSKDKLRPYANNAKVHTDEQIEQIRHSIEEFGFNDPIALWHDNEVIEGHGRLLAVMGMDSIDTVPVIRLDGLTDEQRRAYMLVHNKLTMNTDFDFDLLDIELDDIYDIDMSEYGFDFGDDDENADDDVEHKSLRDRFIVPPFSVLDTRQGYWQDRKREWIGLGLKSNEGRSQNLTFATDTINYSYMHTSMKGVAPQTSVFDPVLCEIAYKWFCTDNGCIYDPFAGGSVRGIVADKLGYLYTGIDLRQEQVDANRQNAVDMEVAPVWICDDSLNVDKYISDETMDMIFTCPPYHDLEVYSDDPRDISNMDYDDFCSVYKSIIEKACRKLKPNRFAVFVVGDIRDKHGIYRNFVDYTKQCFLDCGLSTYNELILIEQIGTGAIRAPRQFGRTRKVVKTHQNVLVMYKGDPKNIKTNFPDLSEYDGEISDGWNTVV